MNLPGGINLNAVKFAEDVQEVALSMIGHVRKVVKLPADAEQGMRFNDDQMTLLRLESMFSEAEFIHEPISTVEAALIDAAKSDAWHSKEKDWGSPDDDCCYGNCGDEGC